MDTLDSSSPSNFERVMNRVLLVDYALKEAELIIWTSNDHVASFRGISNGMICENASSLGIVEVNSGASAGSTQNWMLAVVLRMNQANAFFLRYDLKNPGLNPPTIAGYPQIGYPGCTTTSCIHMSMSAL